MSHLKEETLSYPRNLAQGPSKNPLFDHPCLAHLVRKASLTTLERSCISLRLQYSSSASILLYAVGSISSRDEVITIFTYGWIELRFVRLWSTTNFAVFRLQIT